MVIAPVISPEILTAQKKAYHILKMPRVDEFWGHCFEYHTFKRSLTNERHK